MSHPSIRLSVAFAAFAIHPIVAGAQQAGQPLGAPDASVLAEDERQGGDALAFPRFNWGVAAEVENDWTFSSGDPEAELNDLFPTVGGAFALEFLEGAGVYATAILEPVIDAEDDRAFDDVGLYIEELYAAAQFSGVQIRGGKFNPSFGQASDVAPGVFGADFAEDYELTERIGAGVAIDFDALGGEHALNAAVFMADRSFLSGSAFRNRGQLSKTDGGLSNTDAPQSIAVALDGAVSEVGYTLGARYQAGGEGDPEDEIGFVAGLAHEIEASGPGDLSVLAEGAYLIHAEGAETDTAYLTLGGGYAIGPVAASAVYTLRDIEDATTDHLATTSLEYEIAEGLITALAYKYAEEDRTGSHTIGVLIAYEFGGGVSFAPHGR